MDRASEHGESRGSHLSQGKEHRSNMFKMYSRNKVELGYYRKFGVVIGGGRFRKQN